MHTTVAHYLPNDGQPVSEQQPLASFPPSLYTEHDVIWYGISLWPVWVIWVSCPNFFWPSSLLTGVVLCSPFIIPFAKKPKETPQKTQTKPRNL